MLSTLAVAACGNGGGRSHAQSGDDGGAGFDASLRGPREPVHPGSGNSLGPLADATSGLDDATTAMDATGSEEPSGDGGLTTGPQSCGFTPCAPGQPCPDLTADYDALIGSLVQDTRTFAPTDCAILEGCILTPGTRKLLRFDTATENIGNADLTVGDPTQNACFVYSDCHQHYHFRGVASYTLYQADGTTVAAVGHKQGFCLEDVDPIPSLDPPPANPANPYVCTYQGLHVGWEDDYPAGVDCQWIDITDVPPGPYIVSVVVNAQHYLPESNYDNNEIRAQVTIQ
ncbi:MAG TPA: lysyl oxidase family protein [Polyangiaceae bacterium]|nr:lysyl oxidase family protein [Polyangiaceae bacterium]